VKIIARVYAFEYPIFCVISRIIDIVEGYYYYIPLLYRELTIFLFLITLENDLYTT